VSGFWCSFANSAAEVRPGDGREPGTINAYYDQYKRDLNSDWLSESMDFITDFENFHIKCWARQLLWPTRWFRMLYQSTARARWMLPDSTINESPERNRILLLFYTLYSMWLLPSQAHDNHAPKLACPIRWGQIQKACISKGGNQDASSLCLNAIIVLGLSE
jgi:hypothetical protein